MDETQTSLIFRSFRNTARVYDNEIAQKVAEIEKQGGDFGQVHSGVREKSGHCLDHRRYRCWNGDSRYVRWFDQRYPTCAELVSNIVAEAEEVIDQRLGGMTAA